MCEYQDTHYQVGNNNKDNFLQPEVDLTGCMSMEYDGNKIQLQVFLTIKSGKPPAH